MEECVKKAFTTTIIKTFERMAFISPTGFQRFVEMMFPSVWLRYWFQSWCPFCLLVPGSVPFGPKIRQLTTLTKICVFQDIFNFNRYRAVFGDYSEQIFGKMELYNSEEESTRSAIARVDGGGGTCKTFCGWKGCFTESCNEINRIFTANADVFDQLHTQSKHLKTINTCICHLVYNICLWCWRSLIWRVKYLFRVRAEPCTTLHFNVTQLLHLVM